MFLYILTFAATLQCITLVATTLLINEMLSNLDETTTPSSRPMTSGPMMWVSWPGKWSSMLTEDKALRAVPVRRLEGHNGAKSEIREVFNKVYNKVFKSQSTQALLRMEIFVLILVMMAAAAPLYAAQGDLATFGIALGAGLAISLAALGGGIGQGIAMRGALEGIARNPNASDKIFTPMIIGLALIESLVIYGLVIAFILQGKI